MPAAPKRTSSTLPPHLQRRLDRYRRQIASGEAQREEIPLRIDYLRAIGRLTVDEARQLKRAL